MISLIYKNSHEAAAAVYQRIKSESNQYKMKPYNYNDLSRSLWWILPPGTKSNETAFQHGKFCFFEDIYEGKSVLFCGIHIERGLSSTYGNFKKLEMDPSWSWHYFVRKIKDDTLKKDLEKLVGLSEFSVVQIDGHFHQSKQEYDQLRYVWHDGNFQQAKRNEKGTVFLASTEKTDVFTVLKSLETLECVLPIAYHPITWIDCFIGTYTSFNKDQEDETQKMLEALMCLDRYVIET